MRPNYLERLPSQIIGPLIRLKKVTILMLLVAPLLYILLAAQEDRLSYILIAAYTVIGGFVAIYEFFYKRLLSKEDRTSDKESHHAGKILNIPPRNLNFTGRDVLLASLHTALTSGKNVSLTQSRVMTGLGGVGKTQLALEYIYSFMDDYDIIWWIRSEEPATLAADYAKLANDLNLQEKDSSDQTISINAVKHLLENNDSKWLLVFDNAREPNDLEAYIPRKGVGHIIITSRNANWNSLARPLPVELFDRAESVKFILARTGQDDDNAADLLAEILGDMPLALEQAGAYIVATSISIADYLARFKEKSKEILNRGEPTYYQHTVATTWLVSFEAVQNESPIGADILNLCSFLAPDDIPRWLLSQDSKNLPEALASATNDVLEVDEGIKTLRHYSLINSTKDGFSIHRLVQFVTRDRLSEDAQNEWAKGAVGLIDSAFKYEPDNMKSWSKCSLLLSHSLAAAEHAEKLGTALDITGHLLSETGLYLQRIAEFTEARAALEHALKIDQDLYGHEHPIVARDANNLGLVLLDLHDLMGAKENFERALRIDEKLGPDHSDTARDARNLGSVLRYQSKLENAKKCFERALRIDENIHSPDHPNIAKDVSGLGLVLRDMHKLEEAKKLLERALIIGETIYGPNNVNVAESVFCLGLVLGDLGEHQEAKKYFERTLKIDEDVYGPDHPYVASALNRLGLALRNLGEFQEAKKYFERALKIDEKVYDPDHAHIASVASSLGLVLRDLGELQEAKKCFERALKIDENAYGPSNLKVARDSKGLGEVLRDMHDPEGAKRCFEKALSIFEKDEKVTGQNNRDAVDVRNYVRNYL